MNEEYLKKYLPKEKIEEGLEMLKKGLPPQYIVGNVNFYGNIFKVNKNTLIPRFETEYLIQKLLKYIDKYFNKKIKILDIGTGSGVIAITLAKKINCEVTATDISSKALEVAIENAKINKVNVKFYQSDLYTNITDTFDVIVSNPPYIAFDEKIDDLVKNNEPHIALFAKEEGLYFYKEILKQAPNYLNKKNIIAFEIGENQGKKIKELAQKQFPKSLVTIEKDLAGKDRYVFIINA